MRGGPHVYKTQDGTRVPSVTTVCKQYGGSVEGLLYWAWKQGAAGVTLDEARSGAANIGTIAHAMIEADIKGDPIRLDGVDPALLEKARQAYETWKDWARRMSYTPVCSELPLVSEVHRFGGTCDCVVLGGERTVVDWKTADRIYESNLLQIAAYGILWDETHPDERLQSYAILRLDRDRAHFEYRLYSDLDPAADAFLRLRGLYDVMARVKKAA